MVGAYDTFWREQMCIQGFGEETWGKEATWKDSMKIEIQEVWRVGKLDWIDLAQDRDTQLALVNGVMNFRVT
jgi:hypothetical protein